MATSTRESTVSTYIDLAAVLLMTLVSQSCQPVFKPPMIIHVVDLHLADRDSLAADLRNQSPEISDEEIDRQYAELHNRVQTMQVQQVATLRGLIRQHGIKRVFLEGLHQGNVEQFRQTVDELPYVDIMELHERMAVTGDSAERALLLVTIEETQDRLMAVGAAGQLVISEDLSAVEPLDDSELMVVADPSKNGFRFDGPENRAREIEMAKRLVNSGDPVTVCILGGAHDLGDEIRVLNPKAVYHRVELE